MLLDWKAWGVMERLHQLVLADNQQLGRCAPPALRPQGGAAGADPAQQVHQPAAAAEQAMADGFLGAVKLRLLASRLFSKGQLRLLDLRRTGGALLCSPPSLLAARRA